VADEPIETRVQMPEGSMPVQVVEVCSYIDPDGNNMWGYRLRGETPLSTTLGLLEMLKFDLLADHRERVEEDE
jgi:hypothetical protein